MEICTWITKFNVFVHISDIKIPMSIAYHLLIGWMIVCFVLNHTHKKLKAVLNGGGG